MNILKPTLKMNQIEQNRTQPQELDIIRVVFEYGNKPYNENCSVAEHISDRTGWTSHLKTVMHKAIHAYLQAGSDQDLINHPDQEISELAKKYMVPEHKVSPNWEKMFGIKIPEGNYDYRSDVRSVIFRYTLIKLSENITETRRDIRDKKGELKELEGRLAEWMRYRKDMADQLNSVQIK